MIESVMEEEKSE